MRTVAGFPTCAATRRALTRNSEFATGITTWTAPPPQTGESLLHTQINQGELKGGRNYFWNWKDLELFCINEKSYEVGTSLPFGLIN